MLEVRDIVNDWHVENIEQVVLLLVSCDIYVVHLPLRESEVHLWIVGVHPIQGLQVFHVLEMAVKSNGHSFSDHAVHDQLTALNLFDPFRIAIGDDDGTRIAHHDTVESTFVGLVMDLDIFLVLPVDVSVMVVSGSDLLADDFSRFLLGHWESWVDNQPSEHIEGPGVPSLRDTGAVHLKHEILHVIEEHP